MTVDIVVLILIALALFKGFSRGLIMAIFSFAAFFIGLAAALKLSATVANYLRESSDRVPSAWWPVIAFIAVFLIVALIVRLLGTVVEKSVELATLCWINKLGGFLVYMVLYLLIFSVVLFYLSEMHWIKADTLNNSKLYPYIAPWGPWTMAGLSRLIPAFRDVFTDLQDFFDHVDKQIK